MSQQENKFPLRQHQRVRAKNIRDALRFIRVANEQVQWDIDHGIPLPVVEGEEVDLTREEGYLTRAMVDYLCNKLANSDQLLDMVLKDMPEPFRALYPLTNAVYRHLYDMHDKNYDYFRDQYYGARLRQADYLTFQALQIADDATYDWYLRATKKGVEVAFDREHVQRSKLRVDQRNLLAKRLNPREYNLNRTEITGKDGKPIQGGMEIINQILGDLRSFRPSPDAPASLRGELPAPIRMAEPPPDSRLN